MILNVIQRSLRQRSHLIPVEALLENCEGSRMPNVQPERLTADIATRVVAACPTGALAMEEYTGRKCLRLSYGHCIGCGRCVEVGEGALVPATRFRWTGVGKEQLVRRWDLERRVEMTDETPQPEAVRTEVQKLLGRALNIRQLDAGSCNGCEAEITALTNPYYDLERFGIHFVAAPKHADMLLVTGPVTRNMTEAVRATYEAVPAPKLVVAVGACGCSGGLFAGSHAVTGAVDAVIPVDRYSPGCPPTPAMILSGILEVLGRRGLKSQTRFD